MRIRHYLPALLLICALFLPVSALTPGINLLTGTVLPLDFESDIPGGVLDYGGNDTSSGSVVASVIEGDESNHVLRVIEPITYNVVRFPFSPSLPYEGAYYVSFKAYKTTETTDNNANLWIMKNDGNASHIAKDAGGFKANGGKWLEYGFTIPTFGQFRDGTPDPTDVQHIMIEWQTANASGGSTAAYFDDISVIPAYKITYVGENDTVLRTEYLYEPGKKSFKPVLTHEDRAAFITGFSDKKGGNAVSNVPYENHDITLFAVYDLGMHITLNATSTLLCKAGETASVAASAAQMGQSVTAAFTYSVISGADTVKTETMSDGSLKVTSVKEGTAVIRAAAASGETADICILNDYTPASEPSVEVKQFSVDLSKAAKVGHHQAEACAYDALTGDYALIRDNTLIKPSTGQPYTDGFLNYTISADTSVYPYLLVTYKCDESYALQMRYTISGASSTWYDVARPTLAATNGKYVTVMYDVGKLADGKTMGNYVIGVTTKTQTVPFYLHDVRFSNIPTLQPEKQVRSMVKFLDGDRSVTADGGTLTLRAAFFADDGSQDDVIYSLDAPLATMETNNDGSVTLTAVKNGTLTVTAYAASDEKITDSITVTISGQREKIPVYDIGIMFWGASTLKHGPAESLAWTGNWGMAATSEDKDFAHRYMARIEEAFAPCHITSDIYATSAYDTAVNNDADNTYDYTKHDSYTTIRSRLKEYDPDILLCSVTGNLHASGTLEAAERAYSLAYDMIFETKPDLILFDQYCGIGHNPKAEAVHEYLADRYAAKRFISFHANLAGHDEYFAREWLKIGQSGVAAHFNDAGMDELARQMFEATEPLLRSTLKPAAFLYLPESIGINGADSIAENGGSITLTVTAFPSDATNLVTFSVDDDRVASIDENGTLTAHHNGTVTVTAACLYDESVTASKTVTVSGQPDAYTLTFAPGTTDPVKNLPQPLTLQSGTVTLPDTVPLRDAYTFIGYGMTENAETPVNSVDMTGNVTVYALWKKTDGFEFDGDYPEGAGFTYGFLIDGGFHAEVKDGVLRVVCTDGEKVCFHSPVLDVVGSGTVAFALTSAYRDTSSNVVLTVRTASGSASYTFPLTSADETVYLADTSALSGNITSFDIYVDAAPADRSMFPVSLGFVRFGSSGTVPTKLQIASNAAESIYACYNADGRLLSVKTVSGKSVTALTPDAASFKWFRFGKADALSPVSEPVALTFAK